jgi:hypothetical protein
VAFSQSSDFALYCSITHATDPLPAPFARAGRFGPFASNTD